MLALSVSSFPLVSKVTQETNVTLVYGPWKFSPPYLYPSVVFMLTYFFLPQCINISPLYILADYDSHWPHVAT